MKSRRGKDARIKYATIDAMWREKDEKAYLARKF